MRIPVSHLIGDLGASHLRRPQQNFSLIHPFLDQIFDKGDTHLLGEDGRKMIRTDICDLCNGIQRNLFLIIVLIDVAYGLPQYFAISLFGNVVSAQNNLFQVCAEIRFRAADRDRASQKAVKISAFCVDLLLRISDLL